MLEMVRKIFYVVDVPFLFTREIFRNSKRERNEIEYMSRFVAFNKINVSF